MKIILAGATGFIGSEVLDRSLASSQVSSVVVLSRRPIATSHPKLKTIVLEDFLHYPQSVLDDLAGAEACIWSIGTVPGKMTTMEEMRKVDVDYTLAAAQAFVNSLAPQIQGRKFRFVYVSGFLIERDSTKTLWFAGDMRKARGQLEVDLEQLRKERSDVLETYIVKSGYVLGKGNPMPMFLKTLTRCVLVSEIAEVLINCACDGRGSEILEAYTLSSAGQRLLQKA